MESVFGSFSFAIFDPSYWFFCQQGHWQGKLFIYGKVYDWNKI